MELKVETFAKHPSWTAVKAVLATLHKAGFEAYLAGGCVRDALLGRTANDFDIASSALPEQVEGLFKHTVAVGKAFGTILVMQEGTPVEVTTFRTDGDYKDGRRPEKVEFSSALKDAERRDFTVNALFYDTETDKIVDYVDGIGDLQMSILRTVGNARQRFTEDKLRVLRGVRFASTLGFKIEQSTWLAMREFAPQVSVVSQERIAEELKKMCANGDVVTGFTLLRQSGLSDVLFGGLKILEQAHWPKFLRGLTYLGEQVGLTRTLAWIALAEVSLDSSGRERVLAWLKSQRFGGDVDKAIKFIVDRAGDLKKFDTQALLILAEADGPILLEMMQTLSYAEKTHIADQKLSEFVERYLEIADDQGQLPVNFLNGEDLIKAGIKKGPRFGEILREAHRLQLEQKFHSKEDAIKWLGSHKTSKT